MMLVQLKYNSKTDRACGAYCWSVLGREGGVFDHAARLRIDGLWYGSPYIELAETSYIQSSTGWLARFVPPHPPTTVLQSWLTHPSLQIEYKGRGYFSGKSHSFKATLKPPTSADNTEVIEGHGTPPRRRRTVWLSMMSRRPRRRLLSSLSGSKDEWESRRLWWRCCQRNQGGRFWDRESGEELHWGEFSGLVADRSFLLLMVCMYRTNNASGGGMKLLPRRLGNWSISNILKASSCAFCLVYAL